METKFIFVTGGVVSSLGKGICASSIGRILKNRGLKVFMQKFDPYINVDPGTMSPYQHGEVYVTNDGAETDLDLGHYERFIDEFLTKESNITAGRIYSNVIEKERKGDYLGRTVQVIPHITNEIKNKLLLAALESKADIIITEIGGTVGDIESLPFLEAIRQARRDFGYKNTLYIHNTLVPYLKTSGELKTKPTQHSVKELRSLGIQPDIIILRCEHDINLETREKIAMFCDVENSNVVVAKDQKVLYEVASVLHSQKIDDIILNHFQIVAKDANMDDWNLLINKIKKLKETVRIALVGKYIDLSDAYLSVIEALKHAGYTYNYKVEVELIQASSLDLLNVKDKLKSFHGIIVPGGFGKRGTDGKLAAIRYARENNIPFLGICYGMQLACIEYARNVLNIADANSTEIDSECKVNLIDYLPNQYEGINLGGTLRKGAYDCKLIDNTLTKKLYQNKDIIRERHRHRYEVNNLFRNIFNFDMVVSGINPQTNLVEIIEYKKNDFFIGCQFHPEFLSRPNRSHPLFEGLIKNSIKNKLNKE